MGGLGEPRPEADKTARGLRQQVPMRSRNRPERSGNMVVPLNGRQFSSKTPRSVTHQGQTQTTGPPPGDPCSPVPPGTVITSWLLHPFVMMAACQSNRSNEMWRRRLPPPRSSSLRRHGHSPRRRAGSGWLPPPFARRRGSSVSIGRYGATIAAASCPFAFVVDRGSPSSRTWSTASSPSIGSTPGGRTGPAPTCGMRWPRTVHPSRHVQR